MDEPVIMIPCPDPNCKLTFHVFEEAIEHGKSHSTADDVIRAHLPVADIVERTGFTALPVTNLQGLDGGGDINFNKLLRDAKKEYIQKLREDEEAEKTDASVGDVTGFANSEEADVSIIFLEALKKEHACYLEALSASNDEASSGKRLENLASQLASLAAGHEELAFKIIKSGIDFAFTDVPRHLSFFTRAVMEFVLQLPRANFPEILKNLDNQAQSVNTDVDASGWSSYFACVDTLREYCSNEVDDDFVLNLATPSGSVRIPIQQIGIEGEQAAFDYFSSTFTDKKVTWLNSAKESRLPYDIILEAADQTLEYVEVKSTTVADKNWFQLQMSQWEFALEMGEAFTIAHVFLSDDAAGPKVTVYRNVVQLVKSNVLKLICHPKKRPFSQVSS